MEVVGSVNQAGAVDVLYGSPDGLSESAAQFLHQDGADLHESSEAGDRFGPAVANGDFDGDGFADLAIGSPGEDLKTLGAGAVAILYGGPAGVGTRRDRTIHEPSSAQRHGDHFGAALATGGPRRRRVRRPRDRYARRARRRSLERGLRDGRVRVIQGSATRHRGRVVPGERDR